MTPRSGCRLVVAPMFHLPVDWGRRLFLETGVEGDWRSPDAEELTQFLPAESLPIPRETLTDYLCLFRLPQHLRTAWWRLLEQANEMGTMSADGFDAFAVAVGGFLAFKELPLPEGASLELLVSKPGQRAVPEIASGNPLWGVINLGDEPTSLVYENVPGHDFRDGPRSRSRLPSGTGQRATVLGATVPLGKRDLLLGPSFRVRLLLESGEGCRLPTGGLRVEGYTLDKREPDVLLLVRRRREAEKD